MYRLTLGLILVLLFSASAVNAELELPPALYDSSAAASPAAPDLPVEADFLPVSEAFKPDIVEDSQGVSIIFQIADGYYLYQKNFSLRSPDNSARVTGLSFDHDAKIKNDAYFGEVGVYYHQVVVSAGITRTGVGPANLSLTYQGCADAGLCYPPETRNFQYSGTGMVASPSAEQIDAPIQQSQPTELDTESAGSINAFLSEASLPLVLLMFYALGIGLAFTPCVFPMIPILSGIIAGQKQLTTRKAFSLSTAYVLGMAITYAALGVLVGSLGAGANLQAYMQTPWVLILFAALFVALALAMFGFYELQLPEKLRDRLNQSSQNTQGGTLAGAGLMGIFSAVVVSPCVSAPLAGALLYISTTGDALLGGGALLALGLGMGTPLILIGTGGGKLLPRAGVWMESVKLFFGVALLAVAIWLLERILPASLTLLLWSLLIGLYSVYLGAFDPIEPAWTGWHRFRKGLGMLGFVYAIALLVGALSGARDPLQPLGNLMAAQGASRTESSLLEFTKVHSLSELQQALDEAAGRNQAAIVDVYADWCISCKVMEKEVLNAESVKPRLRQMALIKADVTDTNPETRALLDRYGLFGPPAYLFFDGRGEEQSQHRIMGEMGLAAFQTHLDNTGLVR